MLDRPYFTTHQAGRILGVSLATVVNWIESGRLAAHRTPGGHRRIARAELIAFARAWRLPLPEGLATEGAGRPRVLVLDDDEDHLETVRAMLESDERYDVAIAHSAFSAGVMTAQFRPDTILVEVRMSGLDPLELAQWLRGDGGRAVPVIACSSWADADLRRRIGRDFHAFLEKPVDLDRLLATVSDALAAAPGRQSQASRPAPEQAPGPSNPAAARR